MKTYTIIRDIIFFILWLAILGTCIFIAKMTMVTDSNVVNVNRKIPRDFDGVNRGFDNNYMDFNNDRREFNDNHREVPPFVPSDQESAENDTDVD